MSHPEDNPSNLPFADLTNLPTLPERHLVHNESFYSPEPKFISALEKTPPVADFIQRKNLTING
jgi:hypothetical protein